MNTSFFNSGLSGLSAARLGLATTEHNISNAHTAGFNRQRTVQSTNPASPEAVGYIGQGVQVTTVDRMYSSYLSSHVNQAQTVLSELDAYSAQIEQVDNMLADPSAGLSPVLQEFFKGVQDVAANPSQLPARQAMVSTAQNLASRYQTMAGRLSEISDGVNGQITANVASVNAYATEIGSLNDRIVIAEGTLKQPPNDLLDQRDQLVAELNKLVKVSTTVNTDGSFNVFIGSGQPLVVGNEVMAMTSAPSAADASKLVIGLQTGGGILEMPDALVSGGSLGGLLKFRNESLDRVTNDLGRSAASLALTFNAQNALGMDLQGNIVGDANFVGDFFNISQPTVTENANNVAGGATVTATLDPPSFNGNFFTNLTNSDYELSAVGAAVTLTRLSDNKQWSGADVAAINTALVAEPQGFTLTSSAALTAGNSYLIKPTHDFASNISVNASVAVDARLVAAAAPMRTQPGALNASNTIVNKNTGTATISAGSVATGYQSLTTTLPITLNYNSNTTPASIPPAPNLSGFPATVAVSVTSGGTTNSYAAGFTPIPYISGATITLDGSSPPGGFSFSIDGAPNNGDKFTLAKNATGVSDGRNALALGQLQTQNTMSGKTASYQSAYAQLVSDTGNKTRMAQVKGDAQQALVTQSTSARESLSGVNLDEEAANLIMYQQAYQAAAKSIDIAGKLFDTLLSLG